jgi:hypothetical protein
MKSARHHITEKLLSMAKYYEQTQTVQYLAVSYDSTQYLKTSIHVRHERSYDYHNDVILQTSKHTKADHEYWVFKKKMKTVFRNDH